MRKLLLVALGVAAAACQRQTSTDVALKHQHDAAYQRQVALLQADHVRLGATHPVEGGASFYVLNVEVLNPQNPFPTPDSLRLRLRKLAHLVVVDLAHPETFKAVNVQVTYQKGFFALGSNSTSQSFIYPVASLQAP